MKSQTDQELLLCYSETGSEAAFSEVVHRHVDLMFSAALRMVRNPHLAEDVSQRVFLALADNARTLADRLMLSGWLHRTAQNQAANAIRRDVRRRAREEEASAMNEPSGISIERAALAAMNPNSPIEGTGGTVQERLDQLVRQKESYHVLTNDADPLWATLSDGDCLAYYSQFSSAGEEAALQWLVSNYGRK